MNTALTIGFATTAATLLVTLSLFVATRILARRDQRREVRSLLVARVLDAFDMSTRQLVRPVFAQVWSNGELEFTLLTPRLMLDLSGKDQQIVPWLLRQVQLMQLSVSKRKRIEVRAAVVDRLIQWHNGTIKASWFAEQVKLDPYQRNFAVPRFTRLKQLGRESWAWAQTFLALGVIGVVARKAFTK